MVRIQLIIAIVFSMCCGTAITAEPQLPSDEVTPSTQENATQLNPFPFPLDKSGYLVSDKNDVGTRYAVLLSSATPESRLIKVTTKKHWDAFVEGFAKVDKETGVPLFMPGTRKWRGDGAAKKTDFVPDFDNEAVLVLFSRQNQQIGHSQFMEIEVFENKGELKAFAFFGPPKYHEKNPIPQPYPYNESVQGYFYLVTIPRMLAEHPFTFRMAEQTWGRECSTFSPPITKLSKVER